MGDENLEGKFNVPTTAAIKLIPTARASSRGIGHAIGYVVDFDEKTVTLSVNHPALLLYDRTKNILCFLENYREVERIDIHGDLS